jgi:hypothetical protein
MYFWAQNFFFQIVLVLQMDFISLLKWVHYSGDKVVCWMAIVYVGQFVLWNLQK